MSCPVTVSCGSPPDGSVGVAYTHGFPSTGGPNLYYSISSGSLPPGLELDPATGVVSGTPTTAGTYSFTIKVEDAQFCMAGDDGSFTNKQIVITSPTGSTWTKQTTDITDSGNCIVYGPGAGVWVMGTNTAGQVQQVQTSPDAVTWTKRNSPADGAGQGNVVRIVWSNRDQQFLAVYALFGTNGIMSSPDGITWTDQTVPSISGQWVDLAYSETLGVYVALSGIGGTHTAAYSTDGVTWSFCTTPSSMGNPLCIAWGVDAGLFVAMGGSQGSGNHLWTSPDGITFTQQSNPDPGLQWLGVSWGNGQFTALGRNGAAKNSAVSTDGLTWTISGALTNHVWQATAFGAGVWAMGQNGSAITAAVQTSSVGLTWTAQTTPSFGFIHGVAWGPTGNCSDSASCTITIGGATFNNCWDTGMTEQASGNVFG